MSLEAAAELDLRAPNYGQAFMAAGLDDLDVLGDLLQVVDGPDDGSKVLPKYHHFIALDPAHLGFKFDCMQHKHQRHNEKMYHGGVFSKQTEHFSERTDPIVDDVSYFAASVSDWVSRCHSLVV